MKECPLKSDHNDQGVSSVMRVNEYNTLNEFTDEYIGIWNPSEGHWYGLDFKYNDTVYRLHTGSMYNATNTILIDGRTAIYGLYQTTDNSNANAYILLGEYADMNDLLESSVIGNRKFKDIIMDDATEILGKD